MSSESDSGVITNNINLQRIGFGNFKTYKSHQKSSLWLELKNLPLIIDF